MPSKTPSSIAAAATDPRQRSFSGERRVENPPVEIRDGDERPLVLHSRLEGPIDRLSWLQRLLLFAELSMIAYNDEQEARVAAAAIGFSETLLLDNDGSQAFRFRNAHDCVIACRGTETNEWNDIQADVNVGTVLAETAGRVHRGFKREVDDLWPMIEQVLSSQPLSLWFCGHSLGGAMATICAARCWHSYTCSNPRELYSYGSPRVGDQTYVDEADVVHYRVVNNNDFVTRLPPTWLGYRHTGQEVYFDRHDRLRVLDCWALWKDRWVGVLYGLLRGDLDLLSDHSIHRYIECALRELAASELAASELAASELSASGSPHAARAEPASSPVRAA
jgi:triacylglycerol lipase